MSSSSSPPAPHIPIHVFVFAHPDDESMFFLPTLRWLVDQGETVWFLCLTTGNYDGLGKLREKELEKAGKLLGAQKVIVRNDNDDDDDCKKNASPILDHPTQRYDKEIVAAAIRESLSKHNSNSNEFILYTFDERGVSGHVNHTDVYQGVVHLMEEKARSTMHGKQLQDEKEKSIVVSEAWYLESERNILRKYIPVISWMYLLLSCFVSRYTSMCRQSNNRTTLTFRMHDPRLNWKAMATHKSQFVWYRRLFVVFSSYTYFNKMTRRRSYKKIHRESK